MLGRVMTSASGTVIGCGAATSLHVSPPAPSLTPSLRAFSAQCMKYIHYPVSSVFRSVLLSCFCVILLVIIRYRHNIVSIIPLYLCKVLRSDNKMSVAKRKRVVVSLETKFNAIQRLDKGESIKKVAADLGVGEVTVGDWKRKRIEIEKWVNDSAIAGGSGLTRKTMKKGDYEQTSEALYLWFCQMRSMGSPVTGPIIHAKALDFHKKLKDGDEPFTASDGWVHRWKSKYGIRQLNITGEKLSADHSEISAFQIKLEQIILENGLTSDQLFNCDETGLNHRMLPSKTLASREEQAAPGFKKSKERVTVMLCCNAAGSLKLKPLLIGKAKQPRAFKNLNLNILPTLYANQKSAWMDRHIFTEWFFESFVPIVEAFLKKKNLPRRALLLLDNAPSHPDVNELSSGEIKAMFFPPNVTSLIQPLDQGVIETFKRNYRKKLLQMLLENLENGSTVVESLKKVSIKNAVYWSAFAWDEVKDETLRNSWRKVFGIEKRKQNDAVQHEHLTDLANQLPTVAQITDEDIEEWLNEDQQQQLTDQDIADMVVHQQEEEDAGDIDEVNPHISHSDGLKSIEEAMAYIEQQKESTAQDIMFLQRWRNLAAEKRGKRLSQRSIKDFFGK